MTTEYEHGIFIRQKGVCCKIAWVNFMIIVRFSNKNILVIVYLVLRCFFRITKGLFGELSRYRWDVRIQASAQRLQTFSLDRGEQLLLPVDPGEPHRGIRGRELRHLDRLRLLQGTERTLFNFRQRTGLANSTILNGLFSWLKMHKEQNQPGNFFDYITSFQKHRCY